MKGPMAPIRFSFLVVQTAKINGVQVVCAYCLQMFETLVLLFTLHYLGPSAEHGISSFLKNSTGRFHTCKSALAFLQLKIGFDLRCHT